MAHNLRAIIGKPSVIDALADRFEAVQRVPLNQGFEMVPVGRTLHGEMSFAPDASNPELAVGGFGHLGERTERLLAGLSHVSPVAYVYTEYFGGMGDQAAVAFVDEQLVTPSGEGGRILSWSSSASPISDALAAIGVSRGQSHDEFEAIGLPHHRTTKGWYGEYSISVPIDSNSARPRD